MAAPPNPEDATLEQLADFICADTRRALCERVKHGAWLSLAPGVFRELEMWRLIDENKVPTPRGLELATHMYVQGASLGDAAPHHCSPFPRPPVVRSVDEVMEDVRNSIDPPRRTEVDAYMKALMAFTQRVVQAMPRLPPHLDRHYRGEVTAIAKDLVRDLGLGELSDEQSHQALLVFLARENDDDDGDNVPAPVPEPGETVPA